MQLLRLLACFSVVIFLNFNDHSAQITVTDKERINEGDSSKYLIMGEDKNGNTVVYENTDIIWRGKFDSSTFYADMEINRAIERQRGNSRHGSCGMGIFETKHRTYSVPIYVKDLTDEYILYKKLQEVRRYAEERCKELKLLFDVSSVSIDDFMVSTKKMIDHSIISGNEVLRLYDTVIYEGGQGLLLSQSNEDYFPNLTPSFTGSETISLAINEVSKNVDVEVCYVTRPYLTRHGAGRFDTECKKEEINSLIVDKTNQPNEFQESLRFGYFDIGSFIDRVNRDFSFYKRPVTKSVAITQLNYTNGKLACENSREDISKIIDNFNKYYLLDNEEF